MSLFRIACLVVLSSAFVLSFGHRVVSQTAEVGVADIQDASTYSKVVAISDVHGMYDELLTLLRAGQIINGGGHWSAGRTLFIVVGDSIDKGPKSVEVLNFWIGLQKEAAQAGGRLIHTLGNHEAEFLAQNDTSADPNEFAQAIISKGLKPTDFSNPTTEQGAFLRSEPLAARVGSWLFCHSGFYPDLNWQDFSDKAEQLLESNGYGDDFITGDDSILEAKKWERDAVTLNAARLHLNHASFWGVVFGHQPEAYGIEGRSAAFAGGHFIKIDNGMAPQAGAHPGSLLVFTAPAELSQNLFPHAEIVLPSGQRRPLTPE